MCLTVTAKVLAVHDRTAEVQLDTAVAKVFVCIDNVTPGDWVLLSGGAILSVLEPEAAAETINLLQGMRGK